ncbi:hypothetical protein G7047_11830 [Diaphorobacter sp. HDW4A]|uniref:hypothetical protein n=1 Tax=Diaphorobacter sp. HDW4A TaxID=2714924 RepID=UPI00140CBAAE|nr:hypothetical protein [Diaphorobacter sp. HDW4A]QIL80516.1 hypothetical protein G7047_11830 [Diaphorobacter sp. HDW4A]
MKNSIDVLYRWPGSDFNGGVFYVTIPRFHSKSNDYISKLLSDSWSSEEIVSVKCLSIYLPPVDGGYSDSSKIIALINEMATLESLALPADLLSGIKPKVLNKIKTLRISKPSNEMVGDEIIREKSFAIPEVLYSALNGFDFYLPIRYIKNLSPDFLGRLRWVGMDLDVLDKTLVSLKGLDKLQNFDGFEFRSIKTGDLLERLPVNIKALYLWSISVKNFNFERLKGFNGLKYLWINGYKGIFDFSWISGIEVLKELTITSFEGVRNLNELDKVEGLQLLRVSHVDDAMISSLRLVCERKSIVLDIN